MLWYMFHRASLVGLCSDFTLTCDFFLSHTKPYYVKWNYAIFYGLCGATTYPYLPYEIIDPLDPIGLPQWVPRFQL